MFKWKSSKVLLILLLVNFLLIIPSYAVENKDKEVLDQEKVSESGVEETTDNEEQSKIEHEEVDLSLENTSLKSKESGSDKSGVKSIEAHEENDEDLYESEPNDKTWEASLNNSFDLELNMPITPVKIYGKINSYSDDVDYYEFEIPERGRFVLEAEWIEEDGLIDLSDEEDLTINLYDDERNALTSGELCENEDGSKYVKLDTMLKEGGIYYLSVRQTTGSRLWYIGNQYLLNVGVEGYKVPIEDIKIGGSGIEKRIIVKGDTFKGYYYYITPQNTTEPIRWRSENTSIATVDEQGVVTGVGAGFTTIYLEAEDGYPFDYYRVEVRPNISIENFGKDISVGQTKLLIGWLHNTETINWTTSNPEVLTIEPVDFIESLDVYEANQYPAKIVAKKEGTAIITAITEGNSKASFPFTVTSPEPNYMPVESVSLNKSQITVKEGEYDEGFLNATILPSTADDKELYWISSNPSVAAVHWLNGELYPRSAGEAKIIAISKDNCKIDCVTVNVVKDEEPTFNWETQYDVEENKIWNIEFNMEIDPDTLENIKIKKLSDREEEMVDVKIDESNSKKVIINPPTGGYHSGEAYYLSIGEDLKSVNGKKLLETVNMKFIIK